MRGKIINSDTLRLSNSVVKHRIAGAVQMTLGSLIMIGDCVVTIAPLIAKS